LDTVKDQLVSYVKRMEKCYSFFLPPNEILELGEASGFVCFLDGFIPDAVLYGLIFYRLSLKPRPAFAGC
jgi:hypothetical protein